MEMDRKAVERRKNELLQIREQLLDNLKMCIGETNGCNYWLAKFDESEAAASKPGRAEVVEISSQ